MSTTPGTNYPGILKITQGTELDVWAVPYNSTMTEIDNQIKIRADAITALGTSKANTAHVHAGADITTGTVAAARLPAFTGDVTAAVGTAITVIAANAVTTAKILDANVTNAKLASMVANTIKGTIAGGVPGDLTGANVLTITGAATTAQVTTQVTDATTKEVQNPQSGNYTLAIGDVGKMVTFSGAAVISINTGIFSAGHRIDILQLGTGAVTFGGTLTNRRIFPSTATKLAGQYAGATIWFTNVANECVIIGNVVA